MAASCHVLPVSFQLSGLRKGVLQFCRSVQALSAGAAEVRTRLAQVHKVETLVSYCEEDAENDSAAANHS